MKSATKKKTTGNNDTVLEALTGLEKRLTMLLTNQIEGATQNFKEYVDSRIGQVQNEMRKGFSDLDIRFNTLETKVDTLDKKLDSNTAGLVQLIVTRTGEILTLQDQVNNHETRINVLESKN